MGKEFSGVWSFNTAWQGGRLLSFSQHRRKLVVSQLVLGEKVKRRRVGTGVECKAGNDRLISCCQLGHGVLVLSGSPDDGEVFAAVVDAGPGEVRRESLHIRELEVRGWSWARGTPFLAQAGEGRVWASFGATDEIWMCEVTSETLVVLRSPSRLPTEYGFGALPLRLPDGRLLAAGADPLSRSIYFITPGDEFLFEKAEDMPGEERYCVSTALVGNRFVVGFGGRAWSNRTDRMWIFDLAAGRVSPITRKGDWHPAASWSALAVQDGSIYIFGGHPTGTAHAISFAALLPLIRVGRIRISFGLALGLSFEASSLAQSLSGSALLQEARML